MDQICEIIESLERQDLYRVSKNGLPEDVARQITVLCAEYRSKDSEGRLAMTLSVTPRAAWLIHAFALPMALAAMRRKNTEALTNRSEEHTSELQSLRHLVC